MELIERFAEVAQWSAAWGLLLIVLAGFSQIVRGRRPGGTLFETGVITVFFGGLVAGLWLVVQTVWR